MIVGGSDSDAASVLFNRLDPATYAIEVRERTSDQFTMLIRFIFNVYCCIAFRQDFTITFNEFSYVRFRDLAFFIGFKEEGAPFRARIF